MKRRIARRQKSGINSRAAASRIVPFVLVGIVIILANLVLYKSDLYVFISYLILLPIFLFFRFDYRIFFGYAVVVFLLAAVALVASTTQAAANNLSISAYWLLVVGVICITIDYIRGRDE